MPKKATKKRAPRKQPKPAEYKFNPDLEFWGSSHVSNFHLLKDMYAGRPGLNFLEVGVYEAKTSIWLLENILTADDAKLTGIEVDRHPLLQHNLNVMEESKRYANKYKVLWDNSFHALSVLYTLHSRFKETLYDFIYLDAGHHAKCLLEDIVLAWRILKIGGILLMDDYEMEAKDPWFYIMHKEFEQHPRINFLHPRMAIDVFLSLYRGQYEVVFDNYQKGVRKIVELGEKNLVHGDDDQPESYVHIEKR